MITLNLAVDVVAVAVVIVVIVFRLVVTSSLIVCLIFHAHPNISPRNDPSIPLRLLSNHLPCILHSKSPYQINKLIKNFVTPLSSNEKYSNSSYQMKKLIKNTPKYIKLNLTSCFKRVFHEKILMMHQILSLKSQLLNAAENITRSSKIADIVFEDNGQILMKRSRKYEANAATLQFHIALIMRRD